MDLATTGERRNGELLDVSRFLLLFRIESASILSGDYSTGYFYCLICYCRPKEPLVLVSGTISPTRCVCGAKGSLTTFRRRNVLVVPTLLLGKGDVSV